MNDYLYRGLKAFEPDKGTLWLEDELQLSALESNSPKQRRRLRVKAGHRPFVWFVDDELGNRCWFRDHHRQHFAVVTFSSRDNSVRALQRGFPCDAVVTDVFFPARSPQTDDDANSLLSIYPAMESCKVADLPGLWNKEKSKWSLDGFTVARDFIDRDLTKGHAIPVFLFSRKAVVLLSIDEYLGEPPATKNTYWLIEKPDPAKINGASASRAANIQRDRIKAVLEDRQEAAAFWKRFLRRIRIRIPPFDFDLGGK